MKTNQKNSGKNLVSVQKLVSVLESFEAVKIDTSDEGGGRGHHEAGVWIRYKNNKLSLSGHLLSNAVLAQTLVHILAKEIEAEAVHIYLDWTRELPHICLKVNPSSIQEIARKLEVHRAECSYDKLHILTTDLWYYCLLDRYSPDWGQGGQW